MGLGHFIGGKLVARHTKQRRENLLEEAKSAGLDQSELEQIEPYVDVVAQYGGKLTTVSIWVSMVILALFFLLSIWTLFLYSPSNSDAATGADIIGSILLLFVLIGIYLFPESYRTAKQARQLGQTLKQHPENVIEMNIDQRFPKVASKATKSK